ncbi:restriction endonuclease [Chryseobacterium sp. AG363]|uniref:restriction endonuclease n=1 Tax=Chryseobacterium sp. AG363 TaxID=2183997 RepID=UPI000E74F853|nr:restriction endonuclease [Chryseobacterium sp. AG363]RKE77971.1 restriction endonuclease [Chryseobacterium sp. AG363]
MQITRTKPNSWQDLQIKVAQILERCGFEVTIEKKIKTVRGTVEVDVYADEIINGRNYVILCECKYWGTNIPQTTIHGFRTVISEIGANIGYVITTSNFQSGAKEASANTNLILLTWESFQETFFESWYSKYFYNELNNGLRINKDYYWVDWFDDLTPSDKAIYNNIKNKLLELSEIVAYFPAPFIRDIDKKLFSIPKLPLEKNLFDISDYYGDLPSEILKEENYQEFLEMCISYSQNVINAFEKLNKKYQQN